MLYDIGGITFAERGMVLFYNILTLWPALLLGVPVVKLSQAVGPFKSPLNKFFARMFLPQCERVFPRGDISAGFLADLNLGMDSSPVSADIAFLYKSGYSLSSENPEKVSLLKAEIDNWKIRRSKSYRFFTKHGGYEEDGCPGMRSLSWKSYRKIDQSRISTTSSLPNSNRAGSEKSQNNDILGIQKIRCYRPMSHFNGNDLRKDRMDGLGYKYGWYSQDHWQSQFGSNIPIPLHDFFLSLAVPVYVIGWSHKYHEVLERFRMDEFMRDYKNMDARIPWQGKINCTANRSRTYGKQIKKGFKLIR